MPNEYYTHKLYPLQDAVLDFLNKSNTFFYLTGGTALSRCYLHHRYSDDLDLFSNYNPEFENEVKRIKNLLDKSDFNFKESSSQEFYARFFFYSGDIELKVEFVNDVGFHRGEFNATNIYNKVDNHLNILSNKVCALSRRAAKDIADLIFLSRQYNFSWDEIVKDAREKDSWVNELDAANIVADFQMNEFGKVQFIEPVSEDFLKASMKTISREMLLGIQNSLYQSK